MSVLINNIQGKFPFIARELVFLRSLLFISYVEVTCRLLCMSAMPPMHCIPIGVTFLGSLIAIIVFSQAYVTCYERAALESE